MKDIELTPIAGRLLVDEMGDPIVNVMTCGTCGRSWNDAIISGRTPVPAGRCPFEHLHEDEPAPAKPHVTIVCTRHPDYDNEYATFGGSVEIIDIDMGRMDMNDASECLMWAESHLENVADASDEVRAFVTEIVLDTVNELDDDDIREYVCGTRREPLPIADVEAMLESLPAALREVVVEAIADEED